MKNLLINTLVVVLLMGVSKLAIADNGETCKCTNTRSVSEQLSKMMERASVDSEGAVMVQYSIDANNLIHIEALQSNSEELSNLVRSELEGKKIKMNGSQCTNGFIKINFTGKSPKNNDYFIY